MVLPRPTVKLMVFSLLLSGGLGCSAGVATTPSRLALEAEVGSFQGINAIEKQSVDTWLLSWNPIKLPGTVYAIHRAPEGQAFDFAIPLTTTEDSAYKYTADDVLSEASQCFVVRIFGVPDTNTKSLCSDNRPGSFAGIENIERLGDGTYVLRWTSLPITGVVYHIHERLQSQVYDERLSFSTNTDFLQTRLYERGEARCFRVRAVRPGYGDDPNTTEMCVEAEAPILFSEVANFITVTSPARQNNETTGSIRVTWSESSTRDVVGYRVFHNYSEPMLCKEENPQRLITGSVCTITNLIPGEQRSLSVKAIDAYGRQSSNYVTFPVIVK